jgi:hypothetical protein
MRFCYADPPYKGCARKHYGHLGGREVNHALLVQHLVAAYPDGWALSLHSPSLKYILALCPDDVRVAAWVKPFCSFKPGVNPAYAWEPVIFRGGRSQRGRAAPTVRDWLAEPITVRKGLAGAKPLAYCYWIFDLLGAQQGDTLDDLFPGTGIVTWCWDQFCAAKAAGF